MPRNRTRRRADSTTLNGSSSSAALPPRSKAGCWTCRIRRKRCDEQQDESGCCQACVRLDIECLGWGTRRPDWCRDKDKLNQYKLQLKRKLCSRAGTRPSAAKLAAQHPAAAAHATTSTVNGVRKAPSGESPHISNSGGEEDDSELQETDDSYTPYTPSLHLPNESPLFFSPPHSQWQTLASPVTVNVAPIINMPHQQYTTKQQPAPSSPLSILAPNLPTLLATSSTIPAEYASLISQLIDLYNYKQTAFASTSKQIPSSSSGAAEQEIAHRAQAIEVELTRLSNRASFDSLFSSALSGFGLDTSFFLNATATAASPSSAVGNDIFSSPMTMWSPDLMSDAMSTFSGSSAPTSPAAPLLAMAASNSYSFNEFLGYDNSTNSNMHSLFDSSYAPMSMPQQNTGALGLSSDFMSGYGAASAPSISILPPTRAATLEMDSMSKVAPSSTQTITSAQDVDPFQIHHETCSLLLQAVLSSTETPNEMESFHSSFASSFPGILLDSSSPVEDCLQRLTAKFSPLAQQQQQIPIEYLFSATLAGALSSSNGRRAFFTDIVRGIEERLGSVIGRTLLNEAWA